MLVQCHWAPCWLASLEERLRPRRPFSLEHHAPRKAWPSPQGQHGQTIGSRRVRCGWAQHKVGESAAPVDAAVLDRSDPTNTNVYVGNLDVALTDSEIRRHFSSFGALAEMKLHRKGAYGFVRFRSHADAVRAIVGSNAQVCVVFGGGEGGGGGSMRP